MATAYYTPHRRPIVSRKHRGDILTYFVLTVWLIFVLFPLYWIVAMSLKRETEVFAWPPKFFNFEVTFDNYLAVLNLLPSAQIAVKSDFPRFFGNSLVIVGGAITFTVLFGTLAGYALTRYQFVGREFLALLIIVVRMVPVLTILLPLYIIFRNWGLYNTYMGLILVYQFIGIPFYVWLVRSHIAGVPRDLEDAARVDGCSVIQILYHVVVPVIAPGIVSSGLLMFIYMWNNFLFALILGGTELQPVTVGILNYMGYYQIHYTNLAAACVICMIPVIFTGMFIQKYIVKGLGSGAVKG